MSRLRYAVKIHLRVSFGTTIATLTELRVATRLAKHLDRSLNENEAF